MDEPVVEAVGLEKTYGGVRVLAGVDLAVPAGQVLALLGPNGAGKTTTVRILATLLRPDGGTARIAGLDVTRHRARVRRLLGLTGQSAAVDELLTGRENLRTAARLAGLGRAEAGRRADELLDGFDLGADADRLVRTYSGGLRRRLDLAAGLVGSPSVLFLDEPTTGLDPRSRQALWAAVDDLVAGGVTVLLTTQYLEEADALASRVALLDAGRVVALGTPAELKRRVAEARLEITAADDAALAALADVLGRRVVAGDPATRTLAVPCDDSAAAVRGLLDEVDPQRRRVARFVVRTATLEDAFLALTGSPSTARRPPVPARPVPTHPGTEEPARV